MGKDCTVHLRIIHDQDHLLDILSGGILLAILIIGDVFRHNHIFLVLCLIHQLIRTFYRTLNAFFPGQDSADAHGLLNSGISRNGSLHQIRLDLL